MKFHSHGVSIFWVYIFLTNFIDAQLLTDCQIVIDRTFRPSFNYSLLHTVKLPSASSPTVADCAHVCLRSSRCRTAVFEAQQMSCTLYSEAAASSGSLVVNSSGSFTTIITEKPPDSLISIPNGVSVYAVWNTTAGQNSMAATAGSGTGQYWHAQSPNNVFDGNWMSTFCSYGVATAFTSSSKGGVNTGVYLTIPEVPFILKGFRIVIGSYSTQRNPNMLTIEGSNYTGSLLTLGSSWTLIYNGTAGLDINPGSYHPGIKQNISSINLAFSSYRFLMSQNRGSTSCIEYSEIEMYRG